MTERIAAELELIRSRYPELEYRDSDCWGRIPAYPVPKEWGLTMVEVAFRIPPGLPGEQPYAFWVRPALELPAGGPPTNATGPIATAFGEGWQQFSWAPEVWQPGATAREGTNMLDFVRSFGDRLREIN